LEDRNKPSHSFHLSITPYKPFALSLFFYFSWQFGDIVILFDKIMFPGEYSQRDEHEPPFTIPFVPEYPPHWSATNHYNAVDHRFSDSRSLRRPLPYRTSSSAAECCGDDIVPHAGLSDEQGVSGVFPEINRYEKHSMTDREAAMHIERSFGRARRRHNQLIGRILRDLINRRTCLTDESLENLRVAADKVIFDGKLGDRVKWRWSFAHETQYEKDLLGTTALRAAPGNRGYETLIVLSTPLLRLDSQYNRDLLLSAFFHELIHCYLFIQCGLHHAKDDGHTAGFRKIAGIINEWILQANGHQRLHLCNMRANLDLFRIRRRPQ
jgi:hypothetical protein